MPSGDPQYAQQIIQTVKAAGIHVTFFTVGAALLDTTTNLTNVYKEMMSYGHQVAYVLQFPAMIAKRC